MTDWSSMGQGMQGALQQMMMQKQMAALLQHMQQQQSAQPGQPSLLGPPQGQQPGILRRMGLLGGPPGLSADTPNMVNNQMPGQLPPGQNMIDNQMPNMPAPQQAQMPPDFLHRLMSSGMLGGLFGG